MFICQSWGTPIKPSRPDGTATLMESAGCRRGGLQVVCSTMVKLLRLSRLFGQYSQVSVGKQASQSRHHCYGLPRSCRLLAACASVPHVGRLQLNSAVMPPPREDALSAEHSGSEPADAKTVVERSLGHFCQDLLSDWSLVLLGAWVSWLALALESSMSH